MSIGIGEVRRYERSTNFVFFQSNVKINQNLILFQYTNGFGSNQFIHSPTDYKKILHFLSFCEFRTSCDVSAENVDLFNRKIPLHVPGNIIPMNGMDIHPIAHSLIRFPEHKSFESSVADLLLIVTTCRASRTKGIFFMC